MSSEKQGKRFSALSAFFFGGLVGSALGLLFAPMSGRKTRQKIRDASTIVKEKAISTSHRVKNVTTEKVTDLVGKGKAEVDDTTESVKAAVEAGKTAFVDKKSELADTRSGDKEKKESEETS